MIKRLAFDKYSALYLWALFMLYFGITKSDTFLTNTSFKLVVVENVITGVLALAFLVPLTTGTYDLSIGAMMSMSLVISAYLSKHDVMNPVLGMLVALAACGLAGFISGFFVVKLRVNSFIATLGMSQVITAFILHTSSQSITSPFPKSFMNIGAKQIFGLPRFVYYLGVLAIVLWFVFEHTPLGRYMFATGGNPEAARLAGVRTDRLVWGSLVASALIAGFAGTIYSWKVGNYAQSVGPGYLFPAIAAVFFGASQLKGRANVWGALIALYALAWGIKGLQLTFSTNTIWIEPLFQGVSLLAAVSLASRQGVIKVPRRKTAAAIDVTPIDPSIAPTEAPA
ncbi:MAG TPA: ABC transporter permease [Ilumatobacteraceae bacterium]|jgi:ribose transport system permease protein